MRIFWPRIPKMPQNVSAKLVCPSPKVLDFNEKRVHWASVVFDFTCVKRIYVNQGLGVIMFCKLSCMVVETVPLSANVLAFLLYLSLTKYRNIGRPVKFCRAQFRECCLTNGAGSHCLPTTQPASQSRQETYGPCRYKIQNVCATTQLVRRIKTYS